jgi:hypothetical protein
VEIRLNRPQSLAHQALRPGNSVCAPWSRGIGKSFFQRFVWYSSVAEWDYRPRVGALDRMTGVRVVHLMPTFKACKDIHSRFVDADLARSGKWGWLDAKIDHTSWQIKFPGGSTIQWFGAREADSARGIRCDIVTVDECDDIDPSVVDSVVQPWFSEPWSLGMVLFGGTPRRGRYGLLYREHASGLEGNTARVTDLASVADPEQRQALEVLRTKFTFHATYRDSPETVSPAIVAKAKRELEAKGQLAVFRREWECDFDSAEGLVYPMFDPNFHVRVPPRGTLFSEFLVGGDFGWNDPGVLLLVGVLGHGTDAQLWALDEVYQTQRDPDWWRERAREFLRMPGVAHARWYCDTSRADMIAYYRAAGARTQDFDKGSIEAGVMAVAERLAIQHVGDELNTKFARFYIHPKCKNLIDELSKYRRKRDPRNADRFLDDIEDANNHACDALRYCIVGRFGGVQRRVIESGPGWT